MSTQTLSPTEAAQALDLVERTARQMRHALAEGTMWIYLVLWGAIWALGFLASHFLPATQAGKVWAVLDGGGVVLSFGLGAYYGRKFRARVGAQMALFWLAWLLYGGLILYAAKPASTEQMGLLITLLAMFAYVVLGLWVRSLFLAILGLVITGLTMIGYYAWPAGFNLIMALAGLGLVVSGLYMRQSWR